MRAVIIFSLLIAFLSFPLGSATMVSVNVNATLATGEDWDIIGGYKLQVNSIDARATPRQVWLSLYKDGIKLDDVVLSEGQTYSYNNILSVNINSITRDPTTDHVHLRNLAVDSSFFGFTGKVLGTGESWNLCNEYTLKANSIDARATPRQVWLTLNRKTTKIDTRVDEKVLSEGQTYSYSNVLSANVSSIFLGATTDFIKLENVTVSSSASTYQSTKSLGVGDSWDFCAGYKIQVNSIDARATPRQVWITLYKDGFILDQRTLSQGQTYSFSNSLGTLFSTNIYSIYAGATTDKVDLRSTMVNLSFAQPASSSQPACTEAWLCGSWSQCASGEQTRNCADSNNCGTTTDRPNLTQGCICIEDWNCSEWFDCLDDQKTRSCADQNNCGTEVDKPADAENCLVEECQESWSCDGWTECTDEQQTRTCTDANSCGTGSDKPEEIKKCASETCEASWKCDEWTECVDGIQERICEDLNNCGTKNSPSIGQKCIGDENMERPEQPQINRTISTPQPITIFQIIGNFIARIIQMFSGGQ